MKDNYKELVQQHQEEINQISIAIKEQLNQELLKIKELPSVHQRLQALEVVAEIFKKIH